MDIPPTLMDAANQPRASKHEFHGVSILPLLRGEAFACEGALHWENQHNAAVLAGDCKLVHRYYQQPLLYRPAEDVGEDRNLAAANPEKVAQLSRCTTSGRPGIIRRGAPPHVASASRSRGWVSLHFVLPGRAGIAASRTGLSQDASAQHRLSAVWSR